VVIDANRSADEVTAAIGVYLRPWLTADPPPATPPVPVPDPPPPSPPPALLTRIAQPSR
jgi:hypothetical protein